METKLNSVDFGFNAYCGPAVMSILTGKSTDECAAVIMEVTGRRQIDAVDTASLTAAFTKLGFVVSDMRLVQGSLYGLLVRLAKDDGLYLIGIKGHKVGHIVAVEVKDKQIYFCDNASKVPIPAASSARLMQQVSQCIKLTEPPPPTPEQIRAAKLEKLMQRRYNVNNRINDINREIARLMHDRTILEYELDDVNEQIQAFDERSEENDGGHGDVRTDN